MKQSPRISLCWIDLEETTIFPSPLPSLIGLAHEVVLIQKEDPHELKESFRHAVRWATQHKIPLHWKALPQDPFLLPTTEKNTAQKAARQEALELATGNILFILETEAEENLFPIEEWRHQFQQITQHLNE